MNDERSRELSFLSRKAKEWESMADGLDDIILLLDSECRVVRANRAVEAWGLCPVNDVVGKSALQLFDPTGHDGSVLKLAWRRYVSAGYSQRRMELDAFDQPLGRRLNVQMKRFERDERTDREYPMTLATIRDTTAVEDARHRDRRLAQLTAGQLLQQSLAHELGNPLAALCATLEVMEERPEVRARGLGVHLQRVSEAAGRMRSIIEKALSPEGLGGIAMTDVDVCAVVNRLENVFSAQMTNRGVRLIVSALQGLVARADPVAFEQVLFNALTNASQASELGSVVRVDAFRFKNSIVVTVSDSGRGMSEEALDGMLLPFHSTKTDGLGLGASYSAFLMRKMGGRMQVESAEGYGTHVTFSIESSNTTGGSTTVEIAPTPLSAASPPDARTNDSLRPAALRSG